MSKLVGFTQLGNKVSEKNTYYFVTHIKHSNELRSQSKCRPGYADWGWQELEHVKQYEDYNGFMLEFIYE